jgi:hypothetical protein
MNVALEHDRSVARPPLGDILEQSAAPSAFWLIVRRCGSSSK